MKLARTAQAILVALVLLLSLAAAAGTAWADDTGVSWDAPVPAVDPGIDPTGTSWE